MTTKILLADDSLTIHKVVNLTFAAEDVQIEAVTNGDLAIDKARDIKPDIVLADVFMPGRNGYEVCDAIKQDPELADTPVVLLVGTFEAFDELEAARVGCNGHLTKPFDTSELIDLVRALAGRHEKAEAATEAPAAEDGSILGAVAGDPDFMTRAVGLVSPRTRDSFLGENRILDLFDLQASEPAIAGVANVAATGSEPRRTPVAEPSAPSAAPVIPFPGAARIAGPELHPLALNEEMIDQIVEKVVKRMSDQVVRDIAWEVVPALSEIMIRQYLDELRSAHKS
jgi:CheY-like chemotaxis protein